jgi:trigger factor
MQVSIETTSGLERRLTVVVPSERIDSEVEKRLKDAAKTMRLDGFRKGKVPVKVVKQRFGKGVRQEVMGEVVSDSFYEALSQEKLRPAGEPSFEPLKGDEGLNLEYVAVFEVYPEVAVADLTTIEVTKPVAKMTAADIDKMIEVLREQKATWSEVARAAVEGDQANIDFSGTKDGEAFEGGTSAGLDVILGSNQLIPGFEQAIVGMSAGDEKIVDLTFPADYSVEHLKGAAVEFTIKVNSISEKQPVELNAEFFAAFNVNTDSVEKFRVAVAVNMQRELKNEVNRKVKVRVMDQLADLHSVEIPASLLANEINVLKQQMVEKYAQGVENFDLSMLPDEMFTVQAESRIALGLIVSEIVKSADIKVDSNRVGARINEIASTYDQPSQVIEQYYSQDNLIGSVQSAILEEQVVEYILETAKVSEENVSYEDAMKPDTPRQSEDEATED